MLTHQEENLVIIFSSCDRGLFALAESILEDNKIKYYTRNETLDNVYGSLPVEILVQEKYEEKARLILKDLAY